jgi:hypothetical protein
MRFRTPEIFLGAFLAVAIFATGMLFASSFVSQLARHDQRQTATVDSAKEAVKHGFWEKTADDPVAYFTLWLVGFTGVLAVSTIGLGVATVFLYRAGEKQIDVARIAANAADLSARAAIAVELPVIRITPDRFGYGSSQNGDNPRIEYCAIGMLTFSNLGRTKAFPIEVRCGYTVGDKLPDAPDYTFMKSFEADLIFEPDSKAALPRLNLNDFSIVLAPGDQSRLLDHSVKLWFYCSFVYLDFMQTRHEAGFCWVRFETFGGGGFQADATPAYNLKT